MIKQGLCDSFKQEILQGYHAFTAGFRSPDVFGIALYTAGADLGPETTVYTTANEVSGGGYVAGGQILLGAQLGFADRTVWVTWTNPVWVSASFSAAGALIYNASQLSGGFGRAVAVLSFGGTKNAFGSFTISLPVAGPQSALIRLG